MQLEHAQFLSNKQYSGFQRRFYKDECRARTMENDYFRNASRRVMSALRDSKWHDRSVPASCPWTMELNRVWGGPGRTLLGSESALIGRYRMTSEAFPGDALLSRLLARLPIAGWDAARGRWRLHKPRLLSDTTGHRSLTSRTGARGRKTRRIIKTPNKIDEKKKKNKGKQKLY